MRRTILFSSHELLIFLLLLLLRPPPIISVTHKRLPTHHLPDPSHSLPPPAPPPPPPRFSSSITPKTTSLPLLARLLYDSVLSFCSSLLPSILRISLSLSFCLPFLPALLPILLSFPFLPSSQPCSSLSSTLSFLFIPLLHLPVLSLSFSLSLPRPLFVLILSSYTRSIFTASSP